MGMAILLSCLMCMGTIVVPGGSVIVYTFLASSLGLPLESIAILIGIDWFSGMLRTLMNVDVDVMVAMLVSSKLGDLDREVYNETKVAEYCFFHHSFFLMASSCSSKSNSLLYW